MCLCVSVCVYLWWVSFPHTDPCCLVSFFFQCFTATEKTRTVCGVLLQSSSSSFLRIAGSTSAALVCFLSLSRALLGGFPTSTRTHARTHRDLHSQYIYIYRQRMMLSWVPRIFLLASSFCTALRNFSLVVCGLVALFSRSCKCVKNFRNISFSFTPERGCWGVFQITTLVDVALALLTEH